MSHHVLRSSFPLPGYACSSGCACSTPVSARCRCFVALPTPCTALRTRVGVPPLPRMSRSETFTTLTTLFLLSQGTAVPHAPCIGRFSRLMPCAPLRHRRIEGKSNDNKKTTTYLDDPVGAPQAVLVRGGPVAPAGRVHAPPLLRQITFSGGEAVNVFGFVERRGRSGHRLQMIRKKRKMPPSREERNMQTRARYFSSGR